MRPIRKLINGEEKEWTEAIQDEWDSVGHQVAGKHIVQIDRVTRERQVEGGTLETHSFTYLEHDNNQGVIVLRQITR